MAYTTFETWSGSVSYYYNKAVTFTYKPGERYRIYGSFERDIYYVNFAIYDENRNHSTRIITPTITGRGYVDITEAVSTMANMSTSKVVTVLLNGSNMSNLDYDYRILIQFEKEAPNTAPTTPGTFIQPTGELEIGDSKTISWGGSSDAEGNLAGYTLEVSINGGGFTQIATPTQTNFLYTIPTATSIKFRVKARDAGGLQSAYRESMTFTVTKPKYYWSKYNSLPVYSTTSYSLYWGARETVAGAEITGYDGYVFNSNTGSLTTSGQMSYVPVNHIGVGGSRYFTEGGIVKRYTVEAVGSDYYSAVRYSPTITPNQTITGYNRGSLIQSGIIAVEGTYPTDGRHSDGFWYVRGSRVNQSIAPTGGFTSPASGKVFKPGEVATITFESSNAPNLALYEVDYKYSNGAWQTLANNNGLTRTLTITTDKTLTDVQFRVRAKNTSNVYSDYVYSEIYTVQHNAVPILTLTTTNNQNITENGKLNITGDVLETDNGNAVTIKYAINGGTTRNIDAKISNGTTPISFTKELTMRNGRLYDGTTEVTGNLTEGAGHVLSVWAEDDQGGKSTVQTRTFYVTLNRPVVLTINPFETTSKLINNDNVTVTGNVSDPDGNQITVLFSVNDSTYTEIYSGLDGNFTFNFPVKLLNVGENTFRVKAVDSYNAETIKTITMKKEENLITLARGENRYKVTPPNGRARGLVLWIERDSTLEVKARISMVNEGQPEVFEDMVWNRTENVSTGILEDEFKIQVDEAKTKISLIIEVIGGNGAIRLISGVLAE